MNAPAVFTTAQKHYIVSFSYDITSYRIASSDIDTYYKGVILKEFSRTFQNHLDWI